MVKAVALHAVETLVSPGKTHPETGRLIRAAKTQTHAPGDVIELPRALFSELEADGAVRAATKEDVAVFGEASIKTVPVPPSESSDDVDDLLGGEPDLAKLSKADLEKLAVERNVDIKDAKTKDDIIAALQA